MDNGSKLINPATGLAFGAQTEVGPTGALTLGNFPPLAPREQAVFRQSAVASLQAGVHPEVGVAFPLQAMCQIVVLIDKLQAQVAELEAERSAEPVFFELEPDRSNKGVLVEKVASYIGGALLREPKSRPVDLHLRVRTRDVSTDPDERA